MAAGNKTSGSSEQISSPEKSRLEQQPSSNVGTESTIATPAEQHRWQQCEQLAREKAQRTVDSLFPNITVSPDSQVSSASKPGLATKTDSPAQPDRATGVVGAIKSTDAPTATADKASPNLGLQLRQTFQGVDQDHDGVLTRTEVNFAVQNSTFQGLDAQAVTAIKWQFDRLKDLNQDSPEGISLKDIDKFLELEQAHAKDPGNKQGLDAHHRVVKGVGEAMNATRLSQRLAEGDLFGRTSPHESIKPAAVEQGTSGDCYFMASVASLAAANPETIAKMIHDDGTNAQGRHTYTVTFPGGKEPITIEAPTASELTLYGHATKHGTWPAVLEKAYGEYSRQHLGWFESAKPKDLPAAEIVGQGGQSHNVLELLTGKDYTYHTMMFSSSETLHKQLTESFHPTTSSASDNPSSARPATLALTADTDPFGFGLKGPHEYSVVGYDSVKQEVTLRDPRGPGYEPRYDAGRGEVIPWMKGVEPGTFTMTLAEVQKTFARIHIDSQADS